MPDAAHTTDRMGLPYPDRSQPAAVADYFRQLAEAVDTGAATVEQFHQLAIDATFRPRGTWDATVDYDTLDVVRHNGRSWAAAEPAPAGSEPGVSSVWLLFADSADDAAGDVETLLWMGAV